MNLLLITLVLFLAIIATKFSNKSGLPALLLFLGLGVVFSALGVEFNDYKIANNIATISLMIIMFYGGFGTNWTMAKPKAKEAIVLSTFGVIITAIITGFFCHYILKFRILEAMLLGSIVGSTDFASVSNILISKKLNLKYKTASLLELESGSNDPTAYTMTMIFLSLMLGEEIAIPLLVLKQVVIAIVLGFFIGYIFFIITEKFSIDQDGIFSVFIATAMIGTYALTSYFDGNGYLSIYILGIYIGNHEFRQKRDVIFFYDGLSSIFQIAMFFLLGLLSDVGAILKALPQGLFIMIFMFLIARPIAVFGLMQPFKLKKNQLILLSIAGLRGAAAIAFAIMVINSHVYLSSDMYHIVFVICIFSLLIQGSILPFATRKLNMFDPTDSVLRTFNYYSAKTNLEFIQTKVSKNSPWINNKISEIQIAFNVIIAKIEREGKSIVPRGDTVLKENDLIVLGGEAYFDKTGEKLLDIKISDNHKWANKKLKDIEIPDNELIIMIQKPSGKLIIPRGDIILKQNDRIVLSRQVNK
ncbi:cell volume regulation protein A [Peptoniphilus olsenii]|uniref:Cell volume regulation protein A n=1 Tax=Peptoniphilus olsenii TaxID=411570 RepID=A0ABV2JAL6_9FIRM